MDIINFETMADELLAKTDHTVHRFLDGKYNSATDVVIIGIDSIFDYEETRGDFSENPYITIALLESEDDFDIFRNFGIDAWVMTDKLDELPKLIDIIKEKRGK
jgi:hypothetical protein